MAEWHDKIADNIADKMNEAGKQLGTMSSNQFVDICKEVGNYQRYPKTEARDKIAESLWERHQLRISYGDNAVVVFVDRNAAPII